MLLIVNTATKCGFTHSMRNWKISMRNITHKVLKSSISLATSLVSRHPVPTSIHQFCKLTYGTEFSRFKKIKVNGDDAAPLYKFLKEVKGFAGWDESHPLYPVLDKMLSEADPNYKESADIKWNFTKFLINKKGQVVARFEPTEKFENIAKQIEELLNS